MQKYRDVVVGGLYGHMNIDHFMLQDWKEVKKHVRKGKEYDSEDDISSDNEDAEFTTQSATNYLVSLRDKFAKIPVVANEFGKQPTFDDIGGPFGERYSLSLVAPSLVPNYFPTIRVFSYNISGLESLQFSGSFSDLQPGQNLQTPLLDELSKSGHATSHLELRSVPESGLEVQEELDSEGGKKKRKKKHKKKHKKKEKQHKFKVPEGPSESSAPGPAYFPQTLSLMSYTQYFANLTVINNDYVTGDNADATKWKPGKHHGKTPPKKPKPNPLNLTFEVEYDTASDKIYGLGDLTVRSWLDLAAKIAESEKAKGKKANEVWYRFVRRAFVGTVEEGDVEDMFG
jgi:endopolyphosphatase